MGDALRACRVSVFVLSLAPSDGVAGNLKVCTCPYILRPCLEKSALRKLCSLRSTHQAHSRLPTATVLLFSRSRAVRYSRYSTAFSAENERVV